MQIPRPVDFWLQYLLKVVFSDVWNNSIPYNSSGVDNVADGTKPVMYFQQNPMESFFVRSIGLEVLYSRRC